MFESDWLNIKRIPMECFIFIIGLWDSVKKSLKPHLIVYKKKVKTLLISHFKELSFYLKTLEKAL